MNKRNLKAAIEAGEFIVAPGLHDMIAALVCNKIGFDFVYASGYWTTASAHGLPDAGIATYIQMLERVGRNCRRHDSSRSCRTSSSDVWLKVAYHWPTA